MFLNLSISDFCRRSSRRTRRSEAKRVRFMNSRCNKHKNFIWWYEKITKIELNKNHEDEHMVITMVAITITL